MVAKVDAEPRAKPGSKGGKAGLKGACKGASKSKSKGAHVNNDGSEATALTSRQVVDTDELFD